MKKMETPFSEDLYKILKNATGVSQKYYHTFCGSAHLFLAMFGFLAKFKDATDDETGYKRTYDDLKEILNRYNVDGKKFEASFLQFCPQGEAPEPGSTFNITCDREYTKIAQSLQNLALKNQRSSQVEDLIMELFNDKSFNIYLIFGDITGGDAETDKMYEEITKKFKQQVVAEIKDLEGLAELTNLNKWVKKNPQKVIDANGPVSKIEMALAGRSIRSAILTGPAGTGKTTFVWEFVQRINAGEVPEEFKDKIVYELNQAALVAGTRYRGDMEEKLQAILDVVKENKNVILFIDELHSFLNLGAGSDDSGGAGQLLKPYISRGELQLIASTTQEEYSKYILKDKAFARRFHEVKIEEPNREATRKILEGMLPVETEYFKREIQVELLDKIIDLAEKYTLDQANPAKAINMLELACAYAKVFEENKTAVDVDDVIQSVKLKYNIYISKDKWNDTKKALFEVLLGQDDALNQVLRNLKIVDHGVVDTEKPLISMLFCGPTGTGKTETAKIIAKNFFGSEENIVKINMGEYSTEQDVSKLSGSAPGLVGYDDEPALIKGVREKPNSVVLFDEIEKAHPSVQKILLNILDTGEMQDNKGNRVSFRNTIIIFTTNLGCNKDTGKTVGLGLLKTVSGQSKNEIMGAIERYFSPEFLGRLDDIVFYNALDDSIVKSLIERYLKEYTGKSEDLKDITFNDSDIEEIIKESNINTRGARGVRKAVRKQIVAVEDRKADLVGTTDF